MARTTGEIIIFNGSVCDKNTRCVRKVSDLHLYLRARVLDWPLRGMSTTSSRSRTSWMPQLPAGRLWVARSVCLCPTCFFRSSYLFIVENDRKNRSTNLHQVLLQSRQELYGDDWNDTEVLCGRKYEHNTDKGVVQLVKKHVKVRAMSSQCWLFFSIMRVLCTTNFLQEVRRSTKNITFKFWEGCVMPWEENDRVSGQTVTGWTVALRCTIKLS